MDDRNHVRQIAFVYAMWIAGILWFANWSFEHLHRTQTFGQELLIDFLMFGTGNVLVLFVVRPALGKPPLIKKHGRFRF